jgi:hypothetical protein
MFKITSFVDSYFLATLTKNWVLYFASTPKSECASASLWEDGLEDRVDAIVYAFYGLSANSRRVVSRSILVLGRQLGGGV